ncbi:hypothetical protein Ae201684P_019592 [Aphanomyces euteiches]|nr:hypothetical protein Ae201684P_019592 [Aphanomyces euteiches]
MRLALAAALIAVTSASSPSMTAKEAMVGDLRRWMYQDPSIWRDRVLLADGALLRPTLFKASRILLLPFDAVIHRPVVVHRHAVEDVYKMSQEPPRTRGSLNMRIHDKQIHGFC